MPGPKVVFYTSSTPSTAVQKTEISRLQQLLDVKKVEYDTIDLVTADQEARERMWDAADGSREIPQLHVDGKFIGTFSTIQEMEDFGELDAALGRPKK